MLLTNVEKQRQDENHENILTFFTGYGYVQVKKEDYDKVDNNIIHFTNLSKNLNGSINKSNLKSEIKIQLKTLYGERKLHCSNVKINDKISVLIYNLIEDESKTEENEKNKKWNKNYQYRLISSMGRIKEVNTSKTFLEENLKDGLTLILASPLKLSFSETNHGQGIAIEGNNSCAYKQNGDEHQFALADRGYSSGVNYCEFTLETEPDERNIIIGVTVARKDYYLSSDCKDFWGYIPSDCRKMFYNNGSVENVDYGDVCKMGDKLGILMEFTAKGLNISFFINKLYLGVAFKDLPHNTYYPCVLLLYDGAKVKLTNRIPIPEYNIEQNIK